MESWPTAAWYCTRAGAGQLPGSCPAPEGCVAAQSTRHAPRARQCARGRSGSRLPIGLGAAGRGPRVAAERRRHRTTCAHRARSRPAAPAAGPAPRLPPPVPASVPRAGSGSKEWPPARGVGAMGGGAAAVGPRTPARSVHCGAQQQQEQPQPQQQEQPQPPPQQQQQQQCRHRCAASRGEHRGWEQAWECARIGSQGWEVPLGTTHDRELAEPGDLHWKLSNSRGSRSSRMRAALASPQCVSPSTTAAHRPSASCARGPCAPWRACMRERMHVSGGP
jgi:hypothetical protein